MFDYLYFGMGLSFGVYAILLAYFYGKNKKQAAFEQQASNLKDCRAALAKANFLLVQAHEQSVKDGKEANLLKAEIVKLKLDLENAYKALDEEFGNENTLN